MEDSKPFVLQLFWRTLAYWKSHLIGILLGVIVATGYLLFTTHKYSANLVIAGVEDSEKTGGGVENLQLQVFLDLQTTSGQLKNRFSEFIYLLSSPTMGERLLKDPEIAAALFPSEWDKASQTWHPPGDLKSRVKRAIFYVLGFPTYKAPDGYRTSEFLRGNLTLDFPKTSQLVTVTFAASSPTFPAVLLDRLFIETDQFMRKVELDAARKELDWIVKRVQRVDNVVHQRSLSQLAFANEKKMLLLESDQPFAAKRVGVIELNSMPSSPRPLRMLMLGAVLGFLMSFFWRLRGNIQAFKRVQQ